MARRSYDSVPRPSVSFTTAYGAAYGVEVLGDGDVLLDDRDAGNARELKPDDAIKLGEALVQMGLRAIAMRRR